LVKAKKAAKIAKIAKPPKAAAPKALKKFAKHKQEFHVKKTPVNPVQTRPKVNDQSLAEKIAAIKATIVSKPAETVPKNTSKVIAKKRVVAKPDVKKQPKLADTPMVPVTAPVQPVKTKAPAKESKVTKPNKSTDLQIDNIPQLPPFGAPAQTQSGNATGNPMEMLMKMMTMAQSNPEAF
jgi:hypothetical protein